MVASMRAPLTVLLDALNRGRLVLRDFKDSSAPAGMVLSAQSADNVALSGLSLFNSCMGTAGRYAAGAPVLP